MDECDPGSWHSENETAMLLHLTPADHTLLDFKVMSALAPQAILRMFCAMVNDIKPTYLAEIFV